LAIPLVSLAGIALVLRLYRGNPDALMAFVALLGVSVSGGTAFFLGGAHARTRRQRRRG